ncbi:pentapeptide repeat-containing protein [Candidatus Binatia bacterium]|nr:pentapeptide repeat-containing protein [Candidatus Binatia bacterium]
MDLSYASLPNSILEDIRVEDGRLDCANISGAMIQRGKFLRTKMMRTDFRRSILFMVHFEDASLPYARFDDAQKLAADFTGGYAHGASFTNAIGSPTFNGTSLHDTTWSGARFRPASFTDCSFFAADLRGLTSDGVEFARCTIRATSLATLDFKGTVVASDGFVLDFVSDVAGGDWALLDIAALRDITQRAAATGNLEFAETAYREQKGLELRVTSSLPRRVWSRILGLAYGWGTQPGRLLWWTLALVCLSAMVVTIATRRAGARHGVEFTGRQAPRRWLWWRAACLAAAYFIAIPYPGRALKGSPIMEFFTSVDSIEARGLSLRVLIANWVVGKFAMSLLADSIARRFLA